MTLLELVAQERWQFPSSDCKLDQNIAFENDDAVMKFSQDTWASHKLIDTFFNRSSLNNFSANTETMNKNTDIKKQTDHNMNQPASDCPQTAPAVGLAQNGASELCQASQLTSWIVNFVRDSHFEGLLTDDEGAFARKYFSSGGLTTAIDSHNRFARFRDKCTQSGRGSTLPRASDALRVLDSVQKQLNATQNHLLQTDIKTSIAELSRILSSPLLRELLLAHDLVAERLGQVKAQPLRVRFAPTGGMEVALSRRSEPQTPSAGSAGDLDKNCTQSGNGSLPFVQREGPHRIVMVRRDDKPLGATIRNEGDAVIVARVLQGGRIQRRDLMREGDQIVAINGVAMHGQDIERVCRLLNEMPGILLFRILPNPLAAKTSNTDANHSELYLRALFTYSAQTDRFMPCRELGLSFRRGDVLRVVDHFDVDWWQAHRVYSCPRKKPANNASSTGTSEDSFGGDNSSSGSQQGQLPGLIPSPGFQIRRQRLGAADGCATIPISSIPRRSPSGLFRRIIERKSRRGRTSTSVTKITSHSDPDELEGPNVLTYEAVTELDPSTMATRRPLVVVATPGIGSERLVELLVAAHSEHLCDLPYRSTDPTDQNCLSTSEFEQLRSQGVLLDCHEKNGHNYGFHIESLRERLRSGKTVVVRTNGRDLKFLRVASIKPYIVFLSPPNEIEKLRELRKHIYSLWSDEPESQTFLETIIHSSSSIDNDVGHFFDQVVNLSVFNDALQDLHSIVLKLESEKLWVPAEWMTTVEDTACV